MKPFPLLALLFLVSSIVQAQPRVNVAEDDASNGAYNSGWNSGSNGGTGFGAWVLQQATVENSESFAGFFIANTSSNSIPDKLITSDKAFGMFANGQGFEHASAFRPFDKALAVGDSFSLLMATGPIQAKSGTDDPQPGAIGVTVRSGQASNSSDDYKSGARFEFGHYEGEANYRIHDGETETDSGIPVSESGVIITMSLLTADTYDLEVTTLHDGKTKKFSTRRLGGEGGTPLDSFCIFDRDGEKRRVLQRLPSLAFGGRLNRKGSETRRHFDRLSAPPPFTPQRSAQPAPG